jgi:hypothetical protein
LKNLDYKNAIKFENNGPLGPLSQEFTQNPKDNPPPRYYTRLCDHVWRGCVYIFVGSSNKSLKHVFNELFFSDFSGC